MIEAEIKEYLTFYLYSSYCYYYYYYYYPWQVFPLALADDVSLGSERQQVFSSFQDSSRYSGRS